MSETKFTPGPWEKVYRLNSIGEPLKNGRYVIRQMGDSKREDFYIAESPYAAHRGGDVAVHEANAHLIAAAPDLYEALYDLQRQALQSTLNDPANEWGWEALQKTRAALAKARGEPRPTKTEGEGTTP